MKKMLLVALFALFGGMACAFAQGLPAGSVPPVYGSQAFPDQPYHTGTVFQEIFARLKPCQAQPGPGSQATEPNKGE